MDRNVFGMLMYFLTNCILYSIGYSTLCYVFYSTMYFALRVWCCTYFITHIFVLYFLLHHILYVVYIMFRVTVRYGIECILGIALYGVACIVWFISYHMYRMDCIVCVVCIVRIVSYDFYCT